jgi:uncharacterized membrane protein YbhN (UPF0104 family)
MKRPKWIFLIPHIITIAIAIIFIAYIYRNAEHYRNLLNISWVSLVSILGLLLAFMLVNGAINMILYRALSVPISYNEGFGLSAVNTLANQLPFAGGIVSKAIYLKKCYGLSYISFLSATLALYICWVAASGASGLMVLLYLWLVNGIKVSAILYVSFGCMVASLLIFCVPTNVKTLLPHKWGDKFTQLLAGWRILSANWSLTITLVGLHLLGIFFLAGRFYVALQILSQKIPFSYSLLFAAATILTQLVSFAPGGLGIREAIVASIGYVLGFDTTAIIGAVGFDRLIALLIIIPLGIAFTYILGKKITARMVDGRSS